MRTAATTLRATGVLLREPAWVRTISVVTWRKKFDHELPCEGSDTKVLPTEHQNRQQCADAVSTLRPCTRSSRIRQYVPDNLGSPASMRRIGRDIRSRSCHGQRRLTTESAAGAMMARSKSSLRCASRAFARHNAPTLRLLSDCSVIALTSVSFDTTNEPKGPWQRESRM
jgi:hypothetical protein